MEERWYVVDLMTWTHTARGQEGDARSLDPVAVEFLNRRELGNPIIGANPFSAIRSSIRPWFDGGLVEFVFRPYRLLGGLGGAVPELCRIVSVKYGFSSSDNQSDYIWFKQLRKKITD